MATVLTPDLCVIGAGATGLAVAREARAVGAEVVLVERGEPGAASRKSGALALAALAAAAGHARAAGGNQDFGIDGEAPRVSFRRLREHIAAVVAENAADDSPARLQALGIELVRGTGSFSDARTLKAGENDIRARRFVVATGARAMLPDLPGLLSVPYFTTETIFDNTRKLTHLVVLGAGPSGLEIALAYRRLGCAVTIVEPGRALSQSDPELAEIALRRLRAEGVVLLEQSTITAIQARSQGIGVVVRSGDEPLTLDASHVLVASRRIANLDELNLDAARIRRSRSDPGALALTPALRTTNPRVFAVGEAAGHAPAAHLAAPEARMVVRAALLGDRRSYERIPVPRLTLTDPPIAEVGFSEPMAAGRFRTGYTVLRASYAESDLARAGRDGMGVAKLVVARSGRILGGGIAGAGAGELVALLALAMDLNLEARRLGDLAAPYPTYAELLRLLGERAASAAGPDAWAKRRFSLSRLLP